MPEYEGKVWLKWLALTLFVFIPAGFLTGLLFGDPANGEWDTALAGSTGDLVTALVIGAWLWVFPATAVYFELVNSGLRRGRDDPVSKQSPGLVLAIVALSLAMFFAGPLALIVDYPAW